MHHRETIYLRHRQARFLRPDAHRWIRPDAAKFLRPGADPADVYPALAQRRDRLQRQHDREIADAIAYERSVLAALRAELNEIKADLAQRRRARDQQKYSRDQPRVPAGNGRDSGRWSSGSYGNGDRPRVVIDTTNVDNGDGSGSTDTGSGLAQPMGGIDFGDLGSELGSLNLFNIAPRDNTIDGVRLAGDNDRGGLPIDLAEEEQLGGHAITEHVGSTERYLKDRVRDEAAKILSRGDYFEGLSVGSFPSLSSANRLVNSTISKNRDKVDDVARGIEAIAVVRSRFDSPTGYEAYLPRANAEPYMRDTFGVGVVVLRDRRSARGWRIQSAYPER